MVSMLDEFPQFLKLQVPDFLPGQCLVLQSFVHFTFKVAFAKFN